MSRKDDDSLKRRLDHSGRVENLIKGALSSEGGQPRAIVVPEPMVQMIAQKVAIEAAKITITQSGLHETMKNLQTVLTELERHLNWLRSKFKEAEEDLQNEGVD